MPTARGPRAVCTALALLLWTVPVAPAAGQGLLVRVVDAGTGAPLQGTLVTVQGAGGVRAGQRLSDAAGRSFFPELAAGVYRVEAERIGYAGAGREGVEVGPDGTALAELRLAPRPIALEGIEVESEERCRVRPEEGLRVAAVWDEARKALEAAQLTDREGLYRYRTRGWLEDRDERGRLEHRESRGTRRYARSPYRSRPAEELLEVGFVQEQDDGSTLYFAPDAAVLLSDAFLDTHCFRLRRGAGEEDGWVGLEFEPVSGRRPPEVAGTLWIDGDSFELVRLDYRYVNSPFEARTRNAGGVVHFRRLPDGTWIVPEWSIRMPRLARGQDLEGRPVVYQSGLRVEGGTVLSVEEVGGDLVMAASTATVEGVVLEEISSDPVEGADVRLAWTDERQTTGPDGRFRFAALPPGTHHVTFEHPGLTLYGVAADTVELDVEPGGVGSVQLRLASPLTRSQRACPDTVDSGPANSSVLVGIVVDRESGRPVEGATVAVDWEWYEAVAPAVRARSGGIRAVTGSAGTWLACAVPQDETLRLRVEHEGHAALADSLRIPLGQPFAERRILLGPPAPSRR